MPQKCWSLISQHLVSLSTGIESPGFSQEWAPPWSECLCPTKIYVGAPPPNMMEAFASGVTGRSRWGHEGTVLMMGLASWEKEKRQNFLSLPPHYVRTWEKMGSGQPGRKLSLGTESAATLTWDFPASKTVRNQCLVFQSPVHTYVVWLQQPKLTTNTRKQW